MTVEKFDLFQSFMTWGEARKVGRKLGRYGIRNKIKEVSDFDPTFSNTSFYKSYWLELKLSDFDRANEILNNVPEEDLQKMPEDYYLFHFSDTELINVLKHKDEWNPFDFQLAVKILRERGQSVSDEQIDDMQENRLSELKEPEKVKPLWILAGYFFALFMGVIGVFIGWNFAYSKKILSNGDKTYSYTTSDRIHGKYILFISIFMLLLVVINRISRVEFN